MNSTSIKSLAAAFTFLFSIPSFAATEGNSPLVKQISGQMNFPKALIPARQEKAQVRVSFRVKENGEKEILAVNGPSEELKQFVVQSILKTQLSGATEGNHEYNLVFNFCLL